MMKRPGFAFFFACVMYVSAAGAIAQDHAAILPLDVGLTSGEPGIVLVDAGKPRAVIVVAAEAKAALGKATMENPDPKTEAEKVAWAAKDLQEYVRKISGAELPIMGDNESLSAGPKILVGRSGLTQPFESKIPNGLTPQREEEGYAILTDGQTLVLAGNDELPYHGTEYAVCFFLHRLGVRWYMPGDFGEVVPRRPTIAVGKLDVIDRPDFKMRNWWTHWFADDLRPAETRWKIRNGMNLNTLHAVPGDSSVRSVLPPESEKDNPLYAEVFARDAAGRVYPHMPNLASEKSVQYAANVIKEHFRRNPDATSWGIGADDGLPRDFSPGTEAWHMNFPSLIGRFNDPAGDSTTEEWMQWVHRVSAEVRREFPDHFLSTNGYANRDTPPVTVRPDPSIWIMFAAIWSDTYHAYDNPKSWMTQRQFNMLKSWTSMYDNVYLYDYLYFNLVGCGAPPIPLARRHMHNMPLLKQLGLAGFWNEGRTVRGEAGIFPTYLLARMMWDAELDAREWMQEYFAAWYGPAAESAMAFWEEMEQAIEQGNIGGDRDHLLSLIYTPELIERLRGHLERAESAARGNDWAESRVRLDRATFDHLMAYKAMERAEFDADWPAAMRHADAMVEAIRPAMALSRFYFDIAIEPKPIVGQAYGFYYWGSVHRRNAYSALAALTGGEKGKLVSVLPETARFRVDPRDDGRFDGWFREDWQDANWEQMQTTRPFFSQSPHYLDGSGFPYLGAMWYRLNVDVPATPAGQTIRLHCMAVETEAWVWVNGQFVGHRPYAEGYLRPNPFDFDVTKALRPGQRNSVVVRVHTNYQPAQMAGGLVGRLFLYSPVGPTK
jgi:Domain of unknown function (DUF4838)/Glycosyl hydrolases family 2, sugar binding domain